MTEKYKQKEMYEEKSQKKNWFGEFLKELKEKYKPKDSESDGSDKHI